MLVPFALQKLGAVCGVMVTASHNPKQDNGYKVYAKDGCQIRAPVDKTIANEILDNLKPWTDYRKILEERRRNFSGDPCLGLSRPEKTQEMIQDYFMTLQNSDLKTGQANKIKFPPSSPEVNSLYPPPTFAYTAMHGVGYPFAKKAFRVFELDPFKVVPEQRDPDPSFPTGKF